MRKKTIDKLLKAAIIEQAAEQGELWEKESVFEPIPEESQKRFDAALDGTKRTQTYEFADEPAPAPKRRRVLIAALSTGLAVLVLGIGIVIGVNNTVNGSKPAVPVPEDRDVTETPHWISPEPEPQETASAERNTVYAATVEEFLAAIGSDTEIILTGETYDLRTEAGQVGVVQLQNLKRLQITGSGTTVLKNAAVSAEGCTELVLSGIMFEKSTETVVALKGCSDSRMENCTIRDCVWPAYGVDVCDCAGIAISNCRIGDCVLAIYATQGKALSVTDCEINDCGTALCVSGCEDVSVSGCALHDCWSQDEPQSDDEEQGDASYWIQIGGRSSGVRFADSELYGNKCTFLFGVELGSDISFSNLKLHDNDADLLFAFDVTDDGVEANVMLSDCEICDNRIGTCFNAYADASTVKITLSGTTLRDNRIDRLFDLTHGGDYTVIGCALINNTVETCFRYDTDAEDPSYGSVRDRDGNTLSEAELFAMQP